MFVAQNFHEFHEKICLHENIIVNITAYSVIIMKMLFEAFHGNLVQQKVWTIQYVTAFAKPNCNVTITEIHFIIHYCSHTQV